MKKILITGATGYLGKNICEALLGAGHKVIALVRERSDVSHLLSLKGNLQILRLTEITIGNIFAENFIDVVLHTATSYGRKKEDILDVVETNVIFPLKILAAAIEHNVKHFINTDSALPKEINAYSRSKKQFLGWLEHFSGRIDVLNVIVEYFYGPHDDKTKFVTFVLRELESGKAEIDFTTAQSYRDFIYIDDVVAAFLLLIDKIDDIHGFENIPLGFGKSEMLKEIVKEIQNLSGFVNTTLNFGAIPSRNNEVENSLADISYLKNLGWTPKFTFKQGIHKLIEEEKIINDKIKG